MKAIIFGISGQDGYYLKELLTSRLISVVGVSRSVGDWIKGDVSDYQFVEKIIREERPDYLFHFAAKSATSHESILENHESIATGTINILECCSKHSKKTKIFLSGSGLQFKNTGKPIHESGELISDNSYTLTRYYSVLAGRYYRNLGLKVYIGYFFHHDSPMRKEIHLNKKIVDAAKSNARGVLQTLQIGNPSIIKEFNFAGDFMEAVWLLVNQDGVYEVVIGSGSGHKISEWLEICFRMVGLNWNEFITIPSGYISEFNSLISNPETIFSLGYNPKVDINSLAKMMMSK